MKNLAKTGAVYDGTINGVFTPANPLIRCKKTKCMDFGGVNEWLTSANPISALSIYSIVFWFNDDVIDKVFLSPTVTANYYLQHAVLNNRIAFSFPGNPFLSTMGSPLNVTRMVAVVSDGTYRRCYLDGVKDRVVGSAPVYSNDANVYIGRYSAGGFEFNGRLDNMMFYNIALTPAQIQSIWRSANPR